MTPIGIHSLVINDATFEEIDEMDHGTAYLVAEFVDARSIHLSFWSEETVREALNQVFYATLVFHTIDVSKEYTSYPKMKEFLVETFLEKFGEFQHAFEGSEINFHATAYLCKERKAKLPSYARKLCLGMTYNAHHGDDNYYVNETDCFVWEEWEWDGDDWPMTYILPKLFRLDGEQPITTFIKEGLEVTGINFTLSLY